METPFIFGKIAYNIDFINRTNETKQLVQNFKAGINTILISPRRWGKSSLVAHAAKKAENKQLRFCFIDLYNVRNEEQFYQLLAQEILRVTYPKWKELVGAATKFISKFIPKITYGTSPDAEISIGLDWNEVKKEPTDILNLAEKIAIEKNIKIVICIDEFQNISDFSNPLAFQKQLRANWQKHRYVSYCLYGSKRHMMTEVFASTSMPFYKFGDLIFLEKINEKEWVEYIIKRFNETGKKISITDATSVAKLTENHSYYVQQLAQQSWLRTAKSCSSTIVNEAHENLVNQLNMLFQTITDNLSTSQINFLNAVLSGEEKLSSAKLLSEFHLGTSANVLRIKAALINKEIIDIQNKKVEISDPIYKHWLKKYYFRLK